MMYPWCKNVRSNASGEFAVSISSITEIGSNETEALNKHGAGTQRTQQKQFCGAAG